MVALNWQTQDGLEFSLHEALFSTNEGCGYVLKPPYLLDEVFFSFSFLFFSFLFFSFLFFSFLFFPFLFFPFLPSNSPSAVNPSHNPNPPNRLLLRHCHLPFPCPSPLPLHSSFPSLFWNRRKIGPFKSQKYCEWSWGSFITFWAEAIVFRCDEG